MFGCKDWAVRSSTSSLLDAPLSTMCSTPMHPFVAMYFCDVHVFPIVTARGPIAGPTLFFAFIFPTQRGILFKRSVHKCVRTTHN